MRRRLGVWLVVVGALGVATSWVGGAWSESARAQRRPSVSTRSGARLPTSVFDREVDRLRDVVLAHGGETEAFAPFAELVGHYDDAPDRVLGHLRALAVDRRVAPVLQARARYIEATFLRDSGRVREASDVLASLGVVRDARILGPFANDGRRGFAPTLPPEEARNPSAAASPSYRGAERDVQWRALPGAPHEAWLAIGQHITPAADVCVFAETFVRLERAEPVALYAGAEGALRVYWNGERVIEDPVYRGGDVDRDAARVEGRAGWNRVLAKVCSDQRRPALVLRIGRVDGGAMRVVADADGATEATPAPTSTAPTQATASVPTMLTMLEADLAASPSDAGAHERLARYLIETEGDDPNEHRGRDLATRATELGATVDNLLFAAGHQTTRDDRMRLVARAAALAPTDPRVLVEQAYDASSGASAERALSLYEAIPPTTPAGLTALVLRSGLLESLGFDESARALRREFARLVPASSRSLRMRLVDEDAEGHVAAADALREELFRRIPSDGRLRNAIVEVALAQEDRARVETLLRGELELRPTSKDSLDWAAELAHAIGDEARSVELLDDVAELDPHDADARVRLGLRLLDVQQRERALVVLREALALRPQDAATRRVVEQIQPSARPDEAYAATTETLLARRVTGDAYPAVSLQSLEVHTVHPSGLSSAFHQEAYQVVTEAGARDLRRHAIQYEPSTQWVDLRSVRVHRAGSTLSSYEVGERSLADPEYRIYYSSREVVVTLPELRVGDVVELRYRIEDVAARNEYVDYFGAFRGFQMEVPARHVEQVFLTPAARQLRFNQPSGTRVTHDQRLVDGQRVDRFVAEDVAPMRPEPRMPGYAEVAPYLHVSTFASWQDVGRFWWGLAEPQLAADASLTRTVQELVAGAPDVRTKVARIYAWAIDHVRYVGLEFGIHGHQPYRVVDVVERGYGDCKDTASLLYTMLRIAGIDARIALVRTTRNGEVATEPASLALFDHAIAYVPELDLFLDGTAERAGLQDLPSMDQGALTLVVGPSSAELRHIPLRTAEAAGRTRAIRIQLQAGGGATFDGEERVVGDDAAQSRASLEEPSSRAERIGPMVARLFPGFELRSHRITSIDDREQPLRYSWQGTAPEIGQRAAGEVQLEPCMLTDLARSWALLTERRMPLVLGPPAHYRERRTFVLGPMRLVRVPRGGEVRSEFGSFRVRYATSATEVVADTELLLTRDRVSPAEYAAFRRFAEAADALVRERIVVVGGGR